MGIQSAVDRVRIKLDAKSTKLFPDRCDLLKPTLTPDGYGNVTEVDSAVAQNIPCRYEPLSFPSFGLVGQGVTGTLTHKVTLPFNDNTRIIEPSYRIKVLARTDNEEFVFEQPMFLKDSHAGLVEVAAKVRDV